MRVINLLTSFLPFCRPASASAESALSIDQTCKGYSASNVVKHDRGLTADLDLIGKGCGVYGSDLPKLRLTVEYETDSRLHLLIEDRQGERYQIPHSILPPPNSSPLSSKPDLKFVFHANPFTFQVLRRSTSEVLFDTTATSLIFERQYLRLKTWLPKEPNVYGLGEHTDPFRLYTKDYTRTFWTRDAGGVPYRQNLYGSHPVYVEHRKSGTHGVFLKNSNGMDVKLDKDNSGNHGLEYNIIGGVLDFYFFSGPGPREVARQYAEVVGTPAMVPYWSLGFHQCKYGYRDWFEVAEVVHNYSTAGIPLETIWSDIDYMDHRRIFSLDEGNFPIDKMQQLIKYLHDRDQHYIFMIDPAVAEYDYRPYNRGVEMDVFVKDKKGKKPYRGVVWPGVTVFPDWLHPKATEYWVERFQESFNPETGVDIDGIWIDMNEPASFCRFPCDDPERTARDNGLPPDPPPVREPPRSIPGFPSTYSPPTIPSDGNRDQEPLQHLELRSVSDDKPVRSDVDHAGDNLLSPPYRIANSAGNGDLSDLTMPTNLRHASGHWTYDTHNLYGMMMGIATRKAMLTRRPNDRPFIITRSTFAGAGKYMSKWLGDNFSRWDHYRAQIPQMLAFASIFQIPMVGSDVCGFIGAPSEHLCARWATLGAFNPFFRNHATSDAPNQEFYLWELVTSAAKYAIDIRYRLLDYLYTALARQSEDGTPSLSPLWHWYPQDENTWGLDMQFFYGDCVMVSPVTGDEARDVDIYLPDDIFYTWEDHRPVRGRGEWTKIKNVPFDRIPIHIRGGCIVPLRAESANTTTALRQQPFEVLVAPGLDGHARGTLYLDDGISLDGGKHKKHVHFEYVGGKLKTLLGSGEEIQLQDAGIDVAKVTVLEAFSERDDREEL